MGPYTSDQLGRLVLVGFQERVPPDGPFRTFLDLKHRITTIITTTIILWDLYKFEDKIRLILSSSCQNDNPIKVKLIKNERSLMFILFY